MAVSMFQLIDVFQSVLERTAKTRQHEIDFERFSISEKISELLERLRGEGRVGFEQIFSGDRSRGEIIVTFLALLEMTRLRLTWLFQEGPLEPIYVELRVTDEEAAEANVAASDASFAPPPPRAASELATGQVDADELDELDELDAEAADVFETGATAGDAVALEALIGDEAEVLELAAEAEDAAALAALEGEEGDVLVLAAEAVEAAELSELDDEGADEREMADAPAGEPPAPEQESPELGALDVAGKVRPASEDDEQDPVEANFNDTGVEQT
jgi:segregation and condensation protein A